MATEAHDARAAAATSGGIHRERAPIQQGALPVGGSKTPFAGKTTGIARNRSIGVDVPDLSLATAEIEVQPKGLGWPLVANITTRSQYKVAHVSFVWRSKGGVFAPLTRLVSR